MQRLALAMLAAGAPLLAACQAPPASPSDGAQVALTREAMRASASQSEGPRRTEPSVRAVGAWRGDAEESEE